MNNNGDMDFPCLACFRILSNCPHCSEAVLLSKSDDDEEEPFSVQERKEQIEKKLAEEAEDRLRRESQRPLVVKNLYTFSVEVMINPSHSEASRSLPQCSASNNSSPSNPELSMTPPMGITSQAAPPTEILSSALTSAMTSSNSSSMEEPQDTLCPGTSPALQLDISECGYVNMQAASFSINLGRDVAEIQHITQDISNAVTDVLWAKVAWQNETAIRYRNKYKAEKAQSLRYADWCHNQLSEMRQDLATEKQRKEEEISHIKRIGEEKLKSLSEDLLKSFSVQREGNEREREKLLQQLTETQNWTKNKVRELNFHVQRERESKEEELSALETHYQAEQQKVREAAMTFVLRLEDRDRSVVSGVQAVQSERLSRTVEQLFVQHNIRLLGVSSGLEFLMQAPDSDWQHVVEKELQVRKLLEESLPESARGSSWQPMTRVDDSSLDVNLGQRWAAAAAAAGGQIQPQVTDSTEKKTFRQTEAGSEHDHLDQTMVKEHYDQDQTMVKEHHDQDQTIAKEHYDQDQTIVKEHFDHSQTMVKEHYDQDQTMVKEHHDQDQTIVKEHYDQDQTIVKEQYDQDQTMVKEHHDQDQTMVKEQWDHDQTSVKEHHDHDQTIVKGYQNQTEQVGKTNQDQGKQIQKVQAEENGQSIYSRSESRNSKDYQPQDSQQERRGSKKKTSLWSRMKKNLKQTPQEDAEKATHPEEKRGGNLLLKQHSSPESSVQAKPKKVKQQGFARFKSA